MICLDTNIFIYIASGALSPHSISTIDIAYSVVSKIEALGYHKLQAQEESRLQIIFSKAFQLQITNDVVERAIKLRKHRSMSLGDSIIASTAMENDIELWTANTKDFEHIENLKLHNPLRA